MDAEDKIREKSEQESKPLREKPGLKSRFKPWIRIVAFLVIAVFLPEQVAQAIEFDGRVLWNKPSLYTPTYLKDIQNVDIPLAVKKILLDISGKPVNAIQISPTLTVELEKPLNLSKKRVEEIYNWLEGRPCGSKALYDYLSYKGIAVVEQDVAVLALTIDILNGVVKPEGDPEVIKNSLYALSQASDFFGHKLNPVRLRAPSSELRANLTPFIAHLKSDHYILVTRITDEKVFFIEEHKEEFWPKDKFLKEFSGFALVSNYELRATSYELISDSEAKQILGSRSYKHDFADLSALFEKPDWRDDLLGLGLTLATSVIGGWGGGLEGMVTAFGTTCLTSSISTSLTALAQYEFEWSPGQSALFGMALGSAFNYGLSAAMDPPKMTDTYTYSVPTYDDITGAFMGNELITSSTPMDIFQYTGGTLTAIEPISISLNNFDPGVLGLFRYAPESLQNFAINNPFIAGFATGLVSGAAQGGLQLTLANAFGDSEVVYDSEGNVVSDDYYWRLGLAGLFSSVGTTFALNSLMGALPGGDFDAFNAISDTWKINNYQMPKYMISQGVALGIEYLAAEHDWMKPEYSRILGQGLGTFAGGVANALFPEPPQTTYTYQVPIYDDFGDGGLIGYDTITSSTPTDMFQYSSGTLTPINPIIQTGINQGSDLQRWFDSGSPTLNLIGNSLIDGIVNAGISIGLTKIANNNEDKKWLQASLPYLSFVLSDVFYAGYQSALGEGNFLGNLNKIFTNQSLNYLSFGGTSPYSFQYLPHSPNEPYYTTFDFALFNTKMWDFTGLSQYTHMVDLAKDSINRQIAENPEMADYMDEDDWRSYQLMPDLLQSLVYYGRSFAHAQATNILTDLARDIYADLGGTALGAYSVRNLGVTLGEKVTVLPQDVTKEKINYDFSEDPELIELSLPDTLMTYPDGTKIYLKGDKLEHMEKDVLIGNDKAKLVYFTDSQAGHILTPSGKIYDTGPLSIQIKPAGVSMDVQAVSLNLKKDETGKLAEIREAAIKGRSPDALAWNINSVSVEEIATFEGSGLDRPPTKINIGDDATLVNYADHAEIHFKDGSKAVYFPDGSDNYKPTTFINSLGIVSELDTQKLPSLQAIKYDFSENPELMSLSLPSHKIGINSPKGTPLTYYVNTGDATLGHIEALYSDGSPSPRRNPDPR